MKILKIEFTWGVCLPFEDDFLESIYIALFYFKKKKKNTTQTCKKYVQKGYY